MKKLEFETSKGNFVLVEEGSSVFNECMCSNNYKLICRLKGITEEQASEIVDSVIKDSYGKEVGFKNYPFEGHPFNYPILGTAIQSLNSLIESKGINLFEITYCIDDVGEILYKEAEQNTFYNPYIFKIK